jgi:hypothetical protein
MGEIIIKEVKGKWILTVSSKDGSQIKREAGSLMEITTVLFEMVQDLKK